VLSRRVMKLFSELNLSPEIFSAVSEMGFENPTPIQAQTLPILLGEKRTDFMGLAGTGTGKTVAFGIPMLERIDAKKKSVQALILCPTRELAMQVSKQIDLLGKYKGIRSVPVYGGTGYGDQLYGLRNGGQIVVGTPGRVMDHTKKGSLQLDNLQTVILDEADEMISMGFKEELEAILENVSRETCDFWLFSATMSREVQRVADTYLRKPKLVKLDRDEMLSNKLEQKYYITKEGNKAQILCKLIEAADDFYGLIFCQTKALVGDLTRHLNERGYNSAPLHGDIDQSSRERTMQAFRDRRVKILVCTDVAARGIDVEDITHVINYSIPRELDNYVHRIGRTARGGKAGVALSLVTPSTRGLVDRIERMTKSRMILGKIPSGKEIGMKKVSSLLHGFKISGDYKRAIELLNEEWIETISEMKPEEIAGRFLAVFMPEMLKDGPDKVLLGMSAQREGGGARRGSRRPSNGHRGGGGGGGRSSFRRGSSSSPSSGSYKGDKGRRRPRP